MTAVRYRSLTPTLVVILAPACGGLTLPFDETDGGVSDTADAEEGGECAPGACGPGLGMPAYTCADGSLGGNTGRCLRGEDGTCAWEIRVCPEQHCGATTCALGQYCKKETCDAATGTCADRFVACPAVAFPVCGCDGKTYTNECYAQQAGINVASIGACGSCRGDGDCGATSYCHFADGVCTSAGPAAPTGTCEVVPEGCPKNYAPVCGCDGTTYGNACMAAMARTSVAYAGSCGAMCGGLAGWRCGENEWCDYPDGAICGAFDATGTCRARPDACDTSYAPVCGCDGKTYSNACVAHAAGVDDRSAGACE